MGFSIAVSMGFAAAHQLRLLDKTMEPVHGHNWRVKVTVSARKLDGMGVVMDFHELERRVGKVLEPMRNRHLNELAAFKAMNPSAENVAMYIAESVELPMGVELEGVEVWETDECSAVYRP